MAERRTVITVTRFLLSPLYGHTCAMEVTEAAQRGCCQITCSRMNTEIAKINLEKSIEIIIEYSVLFVYFCPSLKNIYIIRRTVNVRIVINQM